jgi:hypothetical protein
VSNGNGDNPQLPDGFSFLTGQLIPTAPYIFPGEAELCIFLELTATYAGYIPVVGWIIALIAEIIDLILELIDELVSVFSGKPRAQDTLTVAGRFAHGNNFVAHLVATQISRNLSQNNIVLSDSDPAAQKVLAEIRAQAKTMLVAQGASVARASQVIDNVWTQTSSATQPLPPELTQPIPQGLWVVGPQALTTIYVTAYNKAIQNGDDPAQAAKKATKALLNDGRMGDLNLIQILPYQPPAIPVVTNPTNPNYPVFPLQPPLLVPETQPPCPPFNSPAGCLPEPPTPDSSQDEVGQNASAIAYWIQILAIYVMNIFQQMLPPATGGTPSDPVTCTQLTAQVALLTTALGAIEQAIAALVSPTPTPPDFSAIVTAIDSVATAIAAVTAPEPAPPIDLSILNAQAQSETTARALTGANLLAVDAAIQTMIAQVGVQP